MQTPHSRRIYDYRIREAICETGDWDLFPEKEIHMAVSQKGGASLYGIRRFPITFWVFSAR